MVFTPEMREKGLEVRRANALKRRENPEQFTDKKLEKLVRRAPKPPQRQPVTGDEFPTSSIVQLASTVPMNGNTFDWLNSPLTEAVDHLNDLKREYDRAAQIVLQRQSRLPHNWKCWSQLNKALVPKSVLRECRGDIQDGKWQFKDDGHKDAEGKLDPIVTCSQKCYTVYLQNKPIGGLGRR